MALQGHHRTDPNPTVAMDDAPDDPALLQQIATAIHTFVQRFPNHYASAALAGIVNRSAAGENVPADERELVVATLIRAIKDEARNRKFGPRRSPD